MSTLSKALDRNRRRHGGRALLALSLAAALAAAAALPAEAQASRTRPSGGSSGGSASGSGSRSSSPPPTASAPAPRSGGSSATAPSVPRRATRTRPPAGGGDLGDLRDERRPRIDPDVVFVNPWSWWHSYYWNYGWDYWRWYGGSYGPYGGHYGPYGASGPGWYPRRVHDRMGALDLDLSPGDTQVWLDGQMIGTVDRFDGWPSYLWLDEGDYHFVFYREGRRTIAREYRVLPGVVIDVEDRMQRGESVPPEELIPPQPTPRRDARIRRNEERRRAAEAAEAARADEIEIDEIEAGADAAAEDESWRDRAPDEIAAEAAGAGTLRLTVVPADASVYLDGRFLGTGAEVGRLRLGLAIPAGDHVVEVVRPGHAPVTREISVEDGAEVELRIELEPR